MHEMEIDLFNFCGEMIELVDAAFGCGPGIGVLPVIEQFGGPFMGYAVGFVGGGEDFLGGDADVFEFGVEAFGGADVDVGAEGSDGHGGWWC